MDPHGQNNGMDFSGGSIDGSIESQDKNSREELNEDKLRIQDIRIDDHFPDDSSSDDQPSKTTNGFPKPKESGALSPVGKINGDSPKKDGKKTSNKENSQNGENEDRTVSIGETTITKPKDQFSLKKSYLTFKELREAKGYIDKTDFIMIFDQRLGEATCILRPRRSGKSQAMKMLHEFYCVPKIDVKSFDPITKNHANMANTAETTFKGTKICNPQFRQEFYNKHGYEGDGSTFIKDNLNKWPVIEVQVPTVLFSSYLPTQSEIERKLWNSIIRQAYAQYDYVLLIGLVEKICRTQYGKFSKENIEKVYADFSLDAYGNIKEQIDVLWEFIGEKVSPDNQKFYRLYSGTPPFEDIEMSLKFLTEILKGFFNKEVIILVDEHDSPARELYKNISLNNTRDNGEVIAAIKLYSSTITAILRNVGKENIGCTKKLLMFGVSYVIADSGGSGFNNVKIHDIFDHTYSKYFALTQAEVEDKVNDLFNVQQKVKKKIISNIARW
jgi:hypothetical protein